MCFHFIIFLYLMYFSNRSSISFCLCLVLTLLEIKVVSLYILRICCMFFEFSLFFIFFIIFCYRFFQVSNLFKLQIHYFLVCSFFVGNLSFKIIKFIVRFYRLHIWFNLPLHRYLKIHLFYFLNQHYIS